MSRPGTLRHHCTRQCRTARGIRFLRTSRHPGRCPIRTVRGIPDPRISGYRCTSCHRKDPDRQSLCPRTSRLRMSAFPNKLRRRISAPDPAHRQCPHTCYPRISACPYRFRHRIFQWCHCPHIACLRTFGRRCIWNMGLCSRICRRHHRHIRRSAMPSARKGRYASSVSIGSSLAPPLNTKAKC